MDAQLRLLPRTETQPSTGPNAASASEPGHDTAEAPSQWRIDDDARARGRAGISRARDALIQARQPLPAERHSTAA